MAEDLEFKFEFIKKIYLENDRDIDDTEEELQNYL